MGVISAHIHLECQISAELRRDVAAREVGLAADHWDPVPSLARRSMSVFCQYQACDKMDAGRPQMFVLTVES